MEIWFLLSLLAVLCGSFHRVLSKIILNMDNIDPLPFSIIFQVIVGVIILTFATIRGLDFTGYNNYLPNIILMGLLYAIGSYFMFMALEHGEASNATILFSTASIWTFISGVFLLGERPGLYPIIGLLLIILAVIFVSYQKDILKINRKAIVYGLLAGMFMGLAFTNDAYIIGDRDAISYLAFSFFLPALIQLPFLRNMKQSLKPFLKKKVWPLLLVFSVIYAIGNIAVFSAIGAGGLASIVNPMQQLAVVLTVIFSSIFLQEKDNLIRKYFAAFIGVIALVLFSF